MSRPRLRGRPARTPAGRYVRRGTKERLARVLQQQALAGSPGQPVQVVLGEAGTGKSSLLWYLTGLLDGRRAAAPPAETRTGLPSDELRAGAELRPVLLRAEQLLTPGEGDQLLESFELSLKPGCIALLDTADLLLHAAGGRSVLRRAVAVCQQRGIPLAPTCRTRDSAALHDLLGRTPSDVVFHTGDFRGGEDLERAHVLPALPARGPTHRPGEGGGVLLEAAVRGLPVREVVARPLTLRMRFEVYAPQSPPPEIDAAGWYERYWERRVREDGRHGATGHAIPQSPDLSWPRNPSPASCFTTVPTTWPPPRPSPPSRTSWTSRAGSRTRRTPPSSHPGPRPGPATPRGARSGGGF
ncbi:hypothetical protein ACFY7H_22045 [Streptomyces sp. NPDC012794]|uniref:hypothetical protein n=1 Tax=Streptomyces sp. NPDC012794 TaxID=3364850 RepID=UPI0036D1CAB8